MRWLRTLRSNLMILSLIFPFVGNPFLTITLDREVKPSVISGEHEDLKSVAQDVAALPVFWIESQNPETGQARFSARGGSRNYWLEDGVLWITLMPSTTPPPKDLGSIPSSAHSTRWHPLSQTGMGVSLKLSFVGANPRRQAKPFGRLPTHVNVYYGSDPGDWQSGLRSWSGVRYDELYPGIDLEISSKDGLLTPRLIIHPGADLNQIILRVEGADALTLDGDRVQMSTAAGEFTLPLIPVTNPDGSLIHNLPAPRQQGREVIAAPFASPAPVMNKPDTPSQFDVFYSTFLDGANGGISIGYGIAVEQSTGIATITGGTTAADFPSTPGSFDPFHNGGWDVFVVRLNSLGSNIGYATFIGGGGDDYGYGITLGTSGIVYVTGSTRSPDFPTTPGAYDPSHNGAEDVFVLELDAQGANLGYSTFIGGGALDVPWDIVIDSQGQAYVTGSTLSPNFPVTLGAFDTTHGGDHDAFILKLNAAGSTLVYNSFLGGNGFDEAIDVALQGGLLGPVPVVAGSTRSANFPTTGGVFDSTPNGGYDAFLSRMSADGSALGFSTVLGGAQDDLAYGLAVDGIGFLYISGETRSPNFPATPGAFDQTLDGGNDSFAARFNFNASILSYATFLGGSGAEFKAYIAVDDVGMAFVTGETASSDFPVTPGGSGNRNCGAVDAYALRLNASGSRLAYGITLGGNNSDYPIRAMLDNSNQAVYYTGYTESPNFPTTLGAYDPEFSGLTSGMAVKLGLPTAENGSIGPQGGVLNFGNTSYNFGPGTFEASTLIVHAPLPDNPTLVICGLRASRARSFSPGAIGNTQHVLVGEPFDITAVYTDTGLAAIPNQAYTLTVQYSASDLTGVVETSLRLYRWEGQQWVLEPGSVLNTSARTLTATPSFLATWAVMGEPIPGNLVYLPVVNRQEG